MDILNIMAKIMLTTGVFLLPAFAYMIYLKSEKKQPPRYVVNYAKTLSAITISILLIGWIIEIWN